MVCLSGRDTEDVSFFTHDVMTFSLMSSGVTRIAEPELKQHTGESFSFRIAAQFCPQCHCGVSLSFI